MEDLRGYSEDKRVKDFEIWSKWPIWFKCYSAGVLNGKHFYRCYTSEEILMAKKLTWNNKGLELLSKEHRLKFPLAPPPSPPLNPKRNDSWSYKLVFSPLKNFDMPASAPGHISISTKYVIVHFDDCHCGSPPIAVAVKCRCRPAVSLSMPTPNKVSTGCSGKNWV